jgi:hypothetical protein
MSMDLLGLRNELVHGIKYKNPDPKKNIIKKYLSLAEFDVVKEWITGKNTHEYCSYLHDFARESSKHFGSKDPERAGKLYTLLVFSMSKLDNQVGNLHLDDRFDELIRINNIVSGSKPAETIGEKMLTYVISQLEPEYQKKFIKHSTDLINLEKKMLDKRTSPSLLRLKKAAGGAALSYINIFSGNNSDPFKSYLNHVGAALQLEDDVKDVKEDAKNNSPSLINLEDGFSIHSLKYIASEELNKAKNTEYFKEKNISGEKITVSINVANNLPLTSIIDDLYRNRTRDEEAQKKAEEDMRKIINEKAQK